MQKGYKDEDGTRIISRLALRPEKCVNGEKIFLRGDHRRTQSLVSEK